MFPPRSFGKLLAVLAVLLATTTAHEDEVRVFHNLTFSNPHISRVRKENQLTDILSFNLFDGETRVNNKKAISLYMLDPEDEDGSPEWVPASFKISRKPDDQGRMELKKPLVGYELERQNDCKKRGLSKVPYAKSRWGENSCMQDHMNGQSYVEYDESGPGPRECYMVVARLDTSSEVLIQPEGCNHPDWPDQIQGKINWCLPQVTYNAYMEGGEEGYDWEELTPAEEQEKEGDSSSNSGSGSGGWQDTSQDTHTGNRKKRSSSGPYSLYVDHFAYKPKKTKVRFACFATVQYMGASVNLAGGTPSVEAILYYREAGLPWSQLAELPWKSYNNGHNKFRSTLHISTLISQGAETPDDGGCYKCEVSDVDGVIVEELCIGTCGC